MKRRMTLVAWLGRLLLGAMVVAFLVLVGTQFTHMLARNIATAHELRTIERDVVVLRARKDMLERDIRRLSDPHGAVPEIHNRLHLTASNEAIIYLKEAPAPER